MVEEAVYPAQKGDIETPPVVLEGQDVTKEVITKEKEISI
jgi:hypothetical protein